MISVGNLRTGGAGKTPTVAAIANLLRARGERPAILTRGYARRTNTDGVAVVSDGHQVLLGVEKSGDEALMLARALEGVPVLVGADRYLSGCLAERRFGATVHILDDGFQHVALARTVDLLLVDEADLADRLLPEGQLREPLSEASRASALLTTAGPAGAEALKNATKVEPVFQVRRQIGRPRLLRSQDGEVVGMPAFAVAGIARPQRFFDDLRAGGWNLVGTRTFRDHQRFDRAGIEQLAEAARAAGAKCLLTTEKDAVRMEHCAPATMPVAVIPLTITIDPGFTDWMFARLRPDGVA